jgi:hypothetical protein
MKQAHPAKAMVTSTVQREYRKNKLAPVIDTARLYRPVMGGETKYSPRLHLTA